MSGQIGPNFTPIASGIDVKELKNFLNRNPELWDANTIRQDFLDSPHVDTKCIYIRGPTEFSFKEYQGNISAENYPISDELKQIVYNIFNQVCDVLSITELGYVLIVNLLAGGEVFEHKDEGVYAEYYTRYHLVVHSLDGNVFTVNHENAIMREGELWSFNHRVPHSVLNFSTEDRIHIIFDVKEINET